MPPKETGKHTIANMISEQLFKKIKDFIMKKNKYLYMASLAIVSLAMGACSSDDAVTGENGEQNARRIELTATYPTDNNATAVSYTHLTLPTILLV